MSEKEILKKIEEDLYMWLVDINMGDRADYVLGDMIIYKIIQEHFPDLWKEKEKMKESPVGTAINLKI